MGFVIICMRDKDGDEIPIPIMKADEDGDPTEVMAIWETVEEATEFCGEHILCQSSMNMVVDLVTGVTTVV